MLKNNNLTITQSLKYTTQGELIDDDKNIINPKQHNNENWDISQNAIYSSDNYNKWETKFDDKQYELSIFDDEQIFSDEESNLNKYVGKTVVIVENENPWFVNKDNIVTVNSLDQKTLIDNQNINNDIMHKSNSEEPILEYDYSFKDKFENLLNNKINSNIEHYRYRSSGNFSGFKNRTFCIIWFVFCVFISICFGIYENYDTIKITLKKYNVIQ
jgi:hypothetical protein